MTHRRTALFLVAIMILLTMALGADRVRGFAPVEVYKIKSGDTLWKIARDYETTVEDIVKMNQIPNASLIRPGQTIFIPRPGLVQTLVTHIVRPGDTLGGIAKLYEVDVQSIIALNKIENPNRIFPGEKVIISIRNDTLGSRGGERMVIASRDISLDLFLLARVIYAEARGEPFEGQVAVGAVVLNRVRSPLFPNTIEEVIYQPGQFRPVQDGTINLTPDDTAIKAARLALAGEDPSRGALYFCNPKIAKNGWWFETRQKSAVIGDHIFTL